MGTNEIHRKLHLAFVLAIVTLIATPKSTSAFLWLSPDQWRHVRPINEVAQSSEFNSNGWVLFGITSIHYLDVIFLFFWQDLTFLTDFFLISEEFYPYFFDRAPYGLRPRRDMDGVFRLKRSDEDNISQIFRLRRKKGGAGKKSDPMDIGTTFRLKKNQPQQIPTHRAVDPEQRQSFLPNYEDVYVPSMIPI